MNEPTFEQDIKPLFRESDRQAMDYLFDLWDYSDVRDNATAILNQVAAGKMPCDESWSPDKVDLFRRWVEGQTPK
jgi:hypothetical protein